MRTNKMFFRIHTKAFHFKVAMVNQDDALLAQ
jgi:hypothetical protein